MQFRFGTAHHRAAQILGGFWSARRPWFRFSPWAVVNKNSIEVYKDPSDWVHNEAITCYPTKVIQKIPSFQSMSGNMIMPFIIKFNVFCTEVVGRTENISHDIMKAPVINTPWNHYETTIPIHKQQTERPMSQLCSTAICKDAVQTSVPTDIWNTPIEVPLRVVLARLPNPQFSSGSMVDLIRIYCNGFSPIKKPNHTEPAVFWLVPQFHTLSTFAPIQYMGSDHLTIWYICKRCNFGSSFTPCSPICNLVNINWVLSTIA